MSNQNPVVGKALYAEFRKGTSTYQTIITPDGLTKEGRYVPATLYRRQISKLKPRSAWKTQALPALEMDSVGAFQKLNVEDAKQLAYSRLSYVYSTFSRLGDYSFSLYKNVLVIEASAEDLEDVRRMKTPYKLLARITRTRRVQGFSEELFEV